MSHITRDINRVTGTVIGISGKLILYALVILRSPLYSPSQYRLLHGNNI